MGGWVRGWVLTAPRPLLTSPPVAVEKQRIMYLYQVGGWVGGWVGVWVDM